MKANPIAQSSDLYIYLVIGKAPNEHFDSNRVDCYFPFSNSLLLNSISKIFYDLPQDHFQVFGYGREKDYKLLQHTNNKAYYQLGHNEFYTISSNQSIKFKLFSKLHNLFRQLVEEIKNNNSSNILIILQDHGSSSSSYFFNNYSYIKLLNELSDTGKNFFIYDDCCCSGGLIDLFNKNNMLWSYFQEVQDSKSPRKKKKIIASLLYFAELQSHMFNYFKKNIPKYLEEFIDFLSQVPYELSSSLFEDSVIMIIEDILKACDYDINNQEQTDLLLTPINRFFFDKLKIDTNFDISNCIIKKDSNYFSDLDSFLNFLESINVRNFANLLMIKSFYEYTSNKTILRSLPVFTKKNCDLFLDVEKIIIGISITTENTSLNEQNQNDQEETTLLCEQNQNDQKETTSLCEQNQNDQEETIFLNEQNDHSETVKKFKESTEIYQQMIDFFSQYKKSDLFFFEFKSNLEILTSTNADKISISYPTIRVNSITKIFPNTPPFASFIRNAFFCCNEHKIVFSDFVKPIFYDDDTKQFSYFALYKYRQFLEPSKYITLNLLPPNHNVYPDSNSAFTFCPSKLLPKKISALRFFTHHACSYLSQFQKSEYFPKLSFSCGFSKIPSEILINFILFSILPNSNDFLQYLKLNNENFIDILKLTNFILPPHSKETSIVMQSNNASINNNHFEYITFFSIVLSSKIRFLIAQNLLLILYDKSRKNFYDSIYLFSVKELEYAQDFINSKKLDKYINNASDESVILFLNELFSINHIEEYNDILPKKYEKSEGLKLLHEIKESPEFNLQKMFLDLESSILNILPSDAFIFSAIYSYLLLADHKKLNVDHQISKLKNALSQLSKEKIYYKIKDMFNATNGSFIEIKQICNHYIMNYLNHTFEFLQLFYQHYYFLSFCKVSNQYFKISDNFDKFNSVFNESIQSSNIQSFIDLLTKNLHPFPLFCLPFILFDIISYEPYNELLKTFFSDLKSSDLEKQFNNFPKSSMLFDSNHFYTQQFRIHMSNLSLYSEFKKSIIENIDILSKFIDPNNNDISDFLSLSFFQNPFPSSESFEFECNDTHELKYAVDFCSNTMFEKYLQKSISHFIEQFISNIFKFVNFDVEMIPEFDSKTSKSIDDFSLFFSVSENNNVYIDSVLNNLIDLTNSLSISDCTFSIKEDFQIDITHLISSILEAHFNNKVEIEPIVELVAKYGDKFSDPNDCPNDREFMTLCSALSFTLNHDDKFRKRHFKRSHVLTAKEEEEEKDEYYSSSNSEPNSPQNIGNYRNKLADNDTNDTITQILEDRNYENSIEEATHITISQISKLKEKYDIRNKKWTEIIWNIFYDFFNEKLKEINLEFDINDQYSQGMSSYNFLENENEAIMKYFHQLGNIKDLHDKERWIGRFIYLHKENDFQIRSAYVYAVMSSYEFLKIYYIFDVF